MGDSGARYTGGQSRAAAGRAFYCRGVGAGEGALRGARSIACRCSTDCATSLPIALKGVPGSLFTPMPRVPYDGCADRSRSVTVHATELSDWTFMKIDTKSSTSSVSEILLTVRVRSRMDRALSASMTTNRGLRAIALRRLSASESTAGPNASTVLLRRGVLMNTRRGGPIEAARAEKASGESSLANARARSSAPLGSLD